MNSSEYIILKTPLFTANFQINKFLVGREKRKAVRKQKQSGFRPTMTATQQHVKDMINISIICNHRPRWVRLLWGVEFRSLAVETFLTVCQYVSVCFTFHFRFVEFSAQCELPLSDLKFPLYPGRPLLARRQFAMTTVFCCCY